MNTENLLKLAAMLEDDAANFTGMKFDIGTVAEMSEEIKDREIIDKWKPGLNCGTTGCGMGLAAISKQFTDLTHRVSLRGEVVMVWQGRDINYSDAAAELFHIDSLTAEKLFSPDYYNGGTGREGELAVAARIRQLVDQGHLEDISSNFDRERNRFTYG